jgi:hypothetical protein
MITNKHVNAKIDQHVTYNLKLKELSNHGSSLIKLQLFNKSQKVGQVQFFIIVLFFKEKEANRTFFKNI